MASASTEPASATESVYIVRAEVSPEAITRSLQTLLPTRHLPIGRRQFTELDTFDGRIRRAGARLTRTVDNKNSCTVTWRPARGTGMSVRLEQPVNFAWDLPDGPLQQELERVIGVRRLLAQVDGESHGS